jgi:hypothetical protein
MPRRDAAEFPKRFGKKMQVSRNPIAFAHIAHDNPVRSVTVGQGRQADSLAFTDIKLWFPIHCGFC